MRNKSNTKLPWEELDTWANQKYWAKLICSFHFLQFSTCAAFSFRCRSRNIGDLVSWLFKQLDLLNIMTSQDLTTSFTRCELCFTQSESATLWKWYMTWIYLDEQSNDSAIFGIFAQVRNEPWRFLHSSAHFTTTAAESSGSSWVREDTLGTHVEIPNQHGDMEHLSNLYFTSKWNATECSEVVVAPNFSWHVMQFDPSVSNPPWNLWLNFPQRSLTTAAITF